MIVYAETLIVRHAMLKATHSVFIDAVPGRNTVSTDVIIGRDD